MLASESLGLRTSWCSLTELAAQSVVASTLLIRGLVHSAGCERRAHTQLRGGVSLVSALLHRGLRSGVVVEAKKHRGEHGRDHRGMADGYHSVRRDGPGQVKGWQRGSGASWRLPSL